MRRPREVDTMASKAKDDGNRLFKAGRYADAQRHYTQGISCAGHRVDKFLLAQLYSNRSATHLKLHQLPEAKQDAQQAAQLAPQWAKPHIRLAETLHAQRKYVKAVAELEIALGVASANQDDRVAAEIHERLTKYRLLKDAEERGESYNHAYDSTFMNEGAFREAAQAMHGLSADQDPRELLDKLVNLDLGDHRDGSLDRHVLVGHQALRAGRYSGAAREFLAAATNGNAEGMYNYAVLLESGKDVARNIQEAVHWLEKAAAMPVDDSDRGMAAMKNRGIGEALSSLARHYHLGIYYAKDDAKAVELWQRAAKLGSVAAMNALGVLHSTRPTADVSVDLAKARDYLRQSAEKFSNEAMLNLAELHASLQEYDTAARWAESAHKFGFEPAAQVAEHYRGLAQLAAQIQDVDPTIKRAVDEIGSIAKMAGPSLERANQTPTLGELRAIKTPYGRRLYQAKETMMDACAYAAENELEMAVTYAVQAHQVDDCSLVFSPEETRTSILLAKMALDTGAPLDAGLAMMVQPTDPAAAVSFWRSLHQRFPKDRGLAQRAACAMMFDQLAGSDKQEAVKVFDAAFKLLPHPNDDSDPETMDLLYLAGAAHWQLQQLEKAKTLLTRFVKHAVNDGHRKAAEAHFLLGLNELMPSRRRANKKAEKTEKKKMQVAADHLRQGVALTKSLPPFLKRREMSGHQRMLTAMLEMWSKTQNFPLDIPSVDEATTQQAASHAQAAASTSTDAIRGGELLAAGPRRHEKLRREHSSITIQLKTERVEMIKMMATTEMGRTKFAWSLVPPKASTGRRGCRASSPATIDELFSALQDHVYEGRSLECIVVALPVFSCSSHTVIVEDSQREPSKLAVYNASKLLVEGLVPGQVLRIQDPYVRLAQDSSIMLRVDNPANKLDLEEVHAICWCCSVGGGSVSLRSCAKCHRAKYCSGACQKQDWAEFGHRFLCARS